MSAREFRDDDAGYLSWLASHPAGYLINITRSYNATGARMHHASCSTLRDQSGAQTADYVKVCADDWADLETWVRRPRRPGDPAMRQLQGQPPRRTRHAGGGHYTVGRRPATCRPLPRAATGARQLGRRGVGR